jgi:hypothetical protein
MKHMRNFAEFWSSLFAEAQVTYLTFILLTLRTLTKLKTTFGRNLLYAPRRHRMITPGER